MCRSWEQQPHIPSSSKAGDVLPLSLFSAYHHARMSRTIETTDHHTSALLTYIDSVAPAPHVHLFC